MRQLKTFVLFAIIVSSAAACAAQPPDNWSARTWEAMWSVHPDGPAHDPALFLFRRKLDFDAKPEQFVIHVSADQRYRFFVNGTQIANGPARGDIPHWRYETLDLAPLLKPGANVLAAMVWSEGDMAPWDQHTAHTAFIVQGDGPLEKQVNTPGDWRVYRDSGWTPVSRSVRTLYNCVGPSEVFRAEFHPWNWMSPDFDDSKWAKALNFAEGANAAAYNRSTSIWQLVPSGIPQMAETPDRMVSVVRSKGVKAKADFLTGAAPLVIPPKTKAIVLVDREKLILGYPELTVSGGEGAKIRLSYEEALFKYPEVSYWKLIKGNRNDTKNKAIRENYKYDEFYPDGGDRRVFKTLWWRTMRFVQFDIETADEPLRIDDFRVFATNYPFKAQASFDSSDASLRTIFDVGWYSALLCAQETYIDGPFYEEQQYVGDTRVQAFITYYMSLDDRLSRNAIDQIDDSRITEGITQSRYPSRLQQMIPPFSLLWIDMMYDYYMFRDDKEFLRQYLPGIEISLEWFDKYRLGNGLLGNMPWWNFVDWSWPDGVPPGINGAEGSSIVTLQYVLALREAAAIEAALGADAAAKKHIARADAAANAVRKTCWDDTRKLIADTPSKKTFSQHGTILGVLADVVPKQDWKTAMETVINDGVPKKQWEKRQKEAFEAGAFAQCSLYFRFYLHMAAEKAGLGDEYLSMLKPWRDTLALGLTTWPETPGEARSECHAWSSAPTSDLLSIVCGIKPEKPGFASVRVAPHPGSLEWAKCEVPHPNGAIKVSLKKEKGKTYAEIELPPGTPGVFEWKGRTSPLKPGKQKVVF